MEVTLYIYILVVQVLEIHFVLVFSKYYEAFSKICTILYHCFHENKKRENRQGGSTHNIY